MPEDEDAIDWLEEKASWQEVAKARIKAHEDGIRGARAKKTLNDLMQRPSPWGMAPAPRPIPAPKSPAKLMTKAQRRKQEAMKAYKPKDDMIDYLLAMKSEPEDDDPY